MQETPVDLFRIGNSTSPRMDHVRPQDVSAYEENDQSWVLPNSGGISTFSSQGRGRNWWKLDQGTQIPSDLTLVNDHGNHWAWEPSSIMPIEQYEAALRQVNEQFYKVS